MTPPIIRLFPVVTSSQGAASWEVAILQGGTVLKRFSGTGAPPPSIDWDLANYQPDIPRFDTPLVISLNANNPAGENVACRMEPPTDNSPQGRFYCRTVQILVKTPGRFSI